MTIETKIVKCDLCGKTIEESPHGGFWGSTYVISGIFGDRYKADICEDCKDIIRNKRIEQEGESR